MIASTMSESSSSAKHISKDEIFEGVKQCLVEALMLKDPDLVSVQASLIGGLGADSLDFLDMIFHIEERFDIRISKDEINYYSNLGLSEAQTHVDGLLTPAALERLQDMMPEVDPSCFKEGLTVTQLPRLITVETLMNIVERKLGDHATSG